MLLRKASMLTALILGVCVLVPDMDTADAKGRGGSRSSARSSPSRSRTPTRSPSRTRSTKPSRSSSARSGSNRSSSASRKATKPTRTASKADKALAAKAKKNGTSFKNKKAATADFKKKNATKYKSKYASKPATRPSHIPSTTSVGGKNVNVTYNVNNGGYGYMGAGGSWMAYNAMADVAMMSVLMRSSGYHYAGMPNTGAVVVHSNGSFLWIILSIIGGIVVIGVAVSIFNRQGSSSSY